MISQSTLSGINRVSHRVQLGVLGCLSAALLACSTTEAPGPLESGATGRVRLVNLINDATRGRVNASLEGLVFGVDLTYGLSAPASLPAPATALYSPVLTGNRTFVLKRTADTTVTVASLPFTIAADEDRTVYAIGGAGGSAVTGFVILDSNPAAASNQTRVRVVNMAPSAGAVDVFITAVGADLATATPAVANLAYQTASAYLTLSPGTYQLRVVLAGTAPANRTASVTVSTVTIGTTANQASFALAGGTGRTIVIADAATGGTPLRAFVYLDR